MPAIDAVCAGLSAFPKSPWNIKLIGNHEQFLRNTLVNVGRMFEPYFMVVPGQEAFDCGDSLRILACSYPENEAEAAKWIESQRKEAQSRKVILLGHFSVMGCMTGDGRLLAGIPKGALSWVNLGLLGHIHKPQSLTARVHYVGSPFQQNWGEAEEAKRVGIVDTATATVQWVPLGGFPEYLQVGLSEFQEVCDSGTEDRFKVVLKSQAEAAEFYALPLAHRAEPIYDFTVESDKPSAESAPADGHKWSFESVVRRYVERNRPDTFGITDSVDEMIDYGKTIAVVT